MKTAIIGSGVAAVGVLRALNEWGTDTEVTLIDIGEEAAGELQTAEPAGTWTKEYYQQLYSYIRKRYGFAFPPPKTLFGADPPKRNVLDWGNVWESRARGGLTNYWGGSLLPLSTAEFRDWSVTADDLAPYYSRAVDMMGMTGSQDALDELLCGNYVNRPPLETPPIIDALAASVNKSDSGGPYTLRAGASRLALETRQGHHNQCDYSGACMVGCPNNAIYSAKRDIDRFTSDGNIARTVTGKVLAFDPGKRTLQVESNNKQQTIGPYDRIYLCAGCIGSTEIVMRSMNITDGLEMADNTVYSFPILYLGRGVSGSLDDKYFGLTNLIMGCAPSEPDNRFAFLQVYLNYDHMWRYFMPVSSWRAFQPLARYARARILWGRVFTHGDHSQRYGFQLSGNGSFSMNILRKPTPIRKIPNLWQSIRRGIGGGGFFVPNIGPVRHKTSSHYAASMPLGKGLVDVNGQVASGVYVCDSAVFPDSPATSLTFTIAANACRIAHRSISETPGSTP